MKGLGSLTVNFYAQIKKKTQTHILLGLENVSCLTATGTSLVVTLSSSTSMNITEFSQSCMNYEFIAKAAHKKKLFFNLQLRNGKITYILQRPHDHLIDNTR